MLWCSWPDVWLSLFFFFKPSDFSISLKASGKNKHFKVQCGEGVYCIGQRRFNTMDELIEHYKKAPIFTSEHGDKLYLVKPLQWPFSQKWALRTWIDLTLSQASLLFSLVVSSHQQVGNRVPTQAAVQRHCPLFFNHRYFLFMSSNILSSLAWNCLVIKL